MPPTLIDGAVVGQLQQCRGSLGHHSCCRSFSIARRRSARKVSDILSGHSSLCCTWLTCVQLVWPYTLAGVRSRSRACRSANSATKTHPAARRRPVCLHGQHGPKQQRAFAYRSHRQPLLREDCTERVKASHDRATQSWVVACTHLYKGEKGATVTKGVGAYAEKKALRR